MKIEKDLNNTVLAGSISELPEIQRMLFTLMNNLPGIAYRCLNDRDWTMEFISSGCLELTGYHAEEIIQSRIVSYNDIIHPDDRNHVWEQVQEGIRTHQRYRITYRIKTKTNSEKWVWEQGTGVYSDSGEVIAIEGFITDVTERKMNENELNKYREHLEDEVKKRTLELTAANRELETFSYSVSHDLRAPLRAIDGFSKALIEDYYDIVGDEGRDYLNRIRTASQKMSQLIDDMLLLSRLTRDEMKYSTVNLSNMADEIISELRSTEPWRKVEFINTGDIVINADSRLMHAAFENLLGNAWKFTSKKKNARIEFGVDSSRNENVYYIRDNGAGFEMKYADKLFGAFQRLHAVTEFPGTGIGLAIAKRVLNRHGGKIWAESEAGKGTTFYFVI